MLSFTTYKTTQNRLKDFSINYKTNTRGLYILGVGLLHINLKAKIGSWCYIQLKALQNFLYRKETRKREPSEWRKKGFYKLYFFFFFFL